MSPAVRRLVPYARRYRRQFLIGLGCGVVATTVALLSPWVLKFAVDDLHAGVTRGKLAWYAFLLLAIALVGGFFRFLMRRIVIGASRHIEYDLRNDFVAHLQKLPVAYYQARRTGDLMSRATNDLNAVRMMIGPAVMYSATTGLVFVVAILLMLSIDARLTLIALIPLPFVSVAVNVFGSIIHRRFEQIQAQLSDLSAVVQEALAGVRVLRAYGQEEAETERFRRANQEYVDRNRRLIRIQAMFYPALGLLLGVGALLVLWLGSREVIRGRITLGEFVAFNAYLAMLTWPMIAFGWVTNMIQRGLASWKRMLEVLDAAPAISDAGARPDAVPAIRGEIEIRHLTFRYDAGGQWPVVSGQWAVGGGQGTGEPDSGQWPVASGQSVGRVFRPGEENATLPVLADVSLHVPAGRTLALVGATGSGKSTLISLLPRLHEPPPGTVFVDGVDVREIPLAVLRGAIGFVPQEPFLFSDSVFENIAFGVEGKADPAAVARAAATTRLDADLADFPMGVETMVGERGITLSGGQKQRAALARAVIVEPRILILDDALSAVDTYTEEEILARLREVRRGRTAIIVSHRISTVRDADAIAVLDAGRIVERGTHAELVALDGQYAALYRKQLLEEELAAS